MDDNDNKGCSIHDLPDELLSHISQEFVELCDFNTFAADLRKTSYRDRVILCSINHRMRTLAIAMPELWTCLLDNRLTCGDVHNDGAKMMIRRPIVVWYAGGSVAPLLGECETIFADVDPAAAWQVSSGR
jgi:hypothetical protein